MSVVPLSRARLLGLILGMPVAIGLAVGVLAWQRGDAWKAMALDALNGHIEGQLVIEDVALSWWHGFPDISVDVADVVLLTSNQDTGCWRTVGLALDFWSLWGDQPQIGSITLEGGTPSLRSTMKEGGQMPLSKPQKQQTVTHPKLGPWERSSSAIVR